MGYRSQCHKVRFKINFVTVVIGYYISLYELIEINRIWGRLTFVSLLNW